VGEHYSVPTEPIQSALIFLASLIPETNHIKLGSAVHCLAYHHPAVIAGHAALFDHLSKGRFQMGIGTGATPTDFDLFCVAEADRLAMVRESIEMILGIWSSDPPYSFNGKHWSFGISKHVFPELGIGAMGKPYQTPHPPIMIPAMSRGSESVRLAAQRNWICLSANFVPGDVVKDHWQTLCGECGKRGERPNPANWHVGRTLLVTETDAEARTYLSQPNNALWWYFHWILHSVRYGRTTHMLKTAADQDMPDELLTEQYCFDNILIAGSPKTVVEKLAAFREDVGPFETLVISHHDWLPEALWRRHMELVAAEVMPGLRAAVGWQRGAAEG